MATNSCLISISSLFSSTNSTKYSYTHLSTPLRPIKLLPISYSYSSSSLSLKKKAPQLRTLASVLTEQEEGSTLVLEDQNHEQELESGELLNWGGQENVEIGSEEEDEGAEGEEEYEKPPEDAKLFVGNLPYDVDGEGLARLFEQAGVVEIAEVIYNKATDQSRGFGFVTMSTVEEADKAVELLNRYVSAR